MNFEELQNEWKAQPLHMPPETLDMQEQLRQKWHTQQGRVLWSNIAVSAGFTGALVTMGWIYDTWHNAYGLLFTGSIAAMTTLLLVYLWVMWRGSVLKQMDLSLPGNDYVGRYIKALQWRRKTITTYTWVYMLLLWLALMLYMIEVLATENMAVRVGGPAATTAYLLIVKLATRKKIRKQLQEIDELIADLKKLVDN